MKNASRRRAKRVAVGADLSFGEFLARHIRTRSGGFSFEGHAVLEDIAAALADPEIARIDILKATQVGLTTLAGFGYGLWETAVHGRNVGYYLPTDKMARELAGERLRHAAGDELAPALTANVADGIIRLGEGRLYVRGLRTILAALSIPLDVNLYDEVDDLDRDHFLWVRQRLDGSQYAREVAFACGRHPGEGIDARFQEGTQTHRHLSCPACGKADQIPELLFPDNVQRVPRRRSPADEAAGGGRRRAEWRVVCVRCGGPLDVEAHGKWIDHFPDRRSASVSFRLSALSVPWVRLDRLMREWRAAEREGRLLAPFRSSKLAIPDAADRQALTAADLAGAVAEHGESLSEPTGPAFAGVDTGDWCHIAVAVMLDADKLTYVKFDAVRGDDLLDRVKSLDAAYRFAGLLIDQRPEGVLARAVCRALAGVAWLQQFSAADAAKAKELAGESFRVLAFEREETLAEWCDLVRRRPPRLVFPREAASSRTDPTPVPFLESDVARHILAGSQRTEEADAAGYTVYRFRSGPVENHYFMASVFAWRIAEHLCTRRVSPAELTLLGRRATDEL